MVTILRKKAQSLETRLNHATYKKAGALSLFAQARDELHAAAEDAQVVASEADEARRYHEGIAEAATQERNASLDAAAKLSSLIGG